MRTFHAFYNGKQIELQAESSLDAQTKAATLFNISAKRSYRIAILLADVPVQTAGL